MGHFSRRIQEIYRSLPGIVAWPGPGQRKRRNHFGIALVNKKQPSQNCDGCFLLDDFPAFNRQPLIPEKTGDHYGKRIWNQQVFWDEQNNIFILPLMVPVDFQGARFAQSHGRAQINLASPGSNGPVCFYMGKAATFAYIFYRCRSNGNGILRVQIFTS